MTNWEDARVAVDSGANAVGFVFYEKSPRKVDPSVAREIVESLPASVDKVGVFVDAAPEWVQEVADEVGLTAIQLHGSEHMSDVTRFASGNRKVFLALPASVLDQVFAPETGLMWFIEHPEVLSAIVVDSGTAEQRGGTGRAFDWQNAQPWVLSLETKFRVVVAGGLDDANVGQAISVLHPWGVDVASGVEREPGKKDPEKVREFIKAVRDAERKS
jgi:phosphoribosylanthranilate isomerase